MNVIKNFVNEIGVADCQINSFNDFITNRINNIVEEENMEKKILV